MKKEKVFTLIVVALVTLLLSAGPVLAGSVVKKIISEGCRVTPALFAGDTTCPGGTAVTNPDGVIVMCQEDGKWHVRGRQILWRISGGDELVDGTAFNDLDLNCDGPPPAGPTAGHCRMWGSYELIPDAYCNEWGEQFGDEGAEANVCIDVRGSWVGFFESSYHDGVQVAHIECHGTGELKGLKLERYDVIDLGPPGATCVAGGSQPYTLYIYPEWCWWCGPK